MADTADRPAASPPSASIEPAGSLGVRRRPVSIFRILRRFFLLSGGRRLLVVEAVLWLGLSRIALLFVPFRVLVARFGALTPSAKADAGRQSCLSNEQSALVLAVGWSVTRAARYVPFRAVCLPQAIAAQVMLNRRRIASVMHFGVAKIPDEGLAAHAWLDASSIEVTGYPVGPEFVEVARFE